MLRIVKIYSHCRAICVHGFARVNVLTQRARGEQPEGGDHAGGKLSIAKT